jgi:UDP-glucose 4-epimerase
MRVLVTGCAGFIGSHIADRLLDLGHEVFGADNLMGGVMENVPRDMVKAENFTVCELSNDLAVQRMIKRMKPEVIHHLACYPYEGLSQFSPVKVADSVYMASLSIFKAAVNNNVKRVVYYSSMARYGKGNPPYNEIDPRNAVDVYGAAKVAAEIALEAISEATGLEYNILVPHNVCGRRMKLDDAYRGVLSIWVNTLMNGRPFHIFGDGEQKRAFSHVDDVVDPCIKAGFDEKVKREIINIGAEKAVTLNEAADILLREFGSDLKPIYEKDRPCEVKYAYCTVEKSKELLGFQDKKTLVDIFRSIIAYAKKKGPQNFHYEELEITKGAPSVWLERRM